MKLENEFNKEIEDNREIGELLQMALLQKWQFSCLQMVRNHLSSEEVDILDVNVFDGNFIVDSEALTAATQEATNVTFRAHSGGLSLTFQASPMKPNLDPSVCECRFNFPTTLRFSQLRKAVRINFRNQPEVRVNLFAELGERFDGQLMDLSTAGAKIQLLGDITQQLEPSQIIEDCQLLMANGELMDLRAQVRGVTYDTERGLSLVRCEFLELQRSDVTQLQQLLNMATGKFNKVELKVAV